MCKALDSCDKLKLLLPLKYKCQLHLYEFLLYEHEFDNCSLTAETMPRIAGIVLLAEEIY